MKLSLAKNKIALHVCLALTAGALTVGCAGNGSKKTQTAQMEKPVPAVTSSIKETTVETKSQENNQLTATQMEGTSEQKAQMAEIQPAENSADSVIAYPDVELNENTKPEQVKFQFGFDKAELSAEDKEIVIQHARFLVDNPEIILKIQGHTDHHGPKVYNEYLSKKRADAIAKILIEEGVQESQLEIIAMANDAPLADTDDTKLNRRVELNYSEINLVSSEE